MKKVYFVRHAKSSWSDPSKSDVERPLNKRGRRDAPFMAEVLAERVGSIDVAVISIAKRARATAKRFLKEIEVKETIESHELYHAWIETILGLVRGLDNKHESAIFFGHNPGFTYVYNHFDDEGIYNLPTCGIFEIQSESETWSSLSPSNSKTGLLLYPKLFV